MKLEIWINEMMEKICTRFDFFSVASNKAAMATYRQYRQKYSALNPVN